ncbi:MAG: N-acetylglucosamine-6-phosphate deacetylase [Bacteroidales bacterium]
MPDSLLIKNASLYDTHDTTRYDILLDGGKIVRLKPSGEIRQSGAALNAEGLVAVPGFIDIHIHGAGGADSLDGTAEALETISRALARTGTTSFLSTMVVKPGKVNFHLQIAGQYTGKDLGGAELLGIYVEGPFINNAKRGGILSDCITMPSPELLDRIITEAGGAIKIMCLAPEIPGNEDIIRRLAKYGVIAAFGHSDAGYEETVRGFDTGISHVTHLFNAMRPLHHRNPGPLAAIFEHPDVSIELISDSHHVHPSLIKMTWKLSAKNNVVCITDGISGMGLPEGIYEYNNKKYRSENGLARYLDGTLIGSTMSLGNIAKNFMTFTGADFSQAVDAVTINPARIIGVDHRKGSIEPGKDADIVLTDNNFNIHYTIIAGRTVYQKQS